MKFVHMAFIMASAFVVMGLAFCGCHNSSTSGPSEYRIEIASMIRIPVPSDAMVHRSPKGATIVTLPSVDNVQIHIDLTEGPPPPGMSLKEFVGEHRQKVGFESLEEAELVNDQGVKGVRMLFFKDREDGRRRYCEWITFVTDPEHFDVVHVFWYCDAEEYDPFKRIIHDIVRRSVLVAYET